MSKVQNTKVKTLREYFGHKENSPNIQKYSENVSADNSTTSSADAQHLKVKIDTKH